VDAHLISQASPDAAEVVLGRLRAEIAARGIREFAVIDHAAGAREAGLELAEETVVVFGDPRVGTALMQADARAGLDLPLRMLVRALPDGGAEVVYRDPRALAESFAVDGARETLDRLATLLTALAARAAAG
jgi:uncharacterized protein (DUF302 family)